MSDKAYANALARRRELISEIKEIDRFLALYRRYSGTNQEETEPFPLFNEAGNLLAEVAQNETDSPRKKTRGYPQIIGDAVERILRDSGRPMNRTELSETLEERGIMIPSDDKPRYVGTILWRQGRRFRNIEGRGYWLQQEPLPE